MSLTPEQIQKNIDTYNRLNPPSPKRDAQEAAINRLYDRLVKAGIIDDDLPTDYKE